LRSIGECIFYVQLIGEMGIPIAESTQIINLGQLKDTIAVSLHESIYLLGKSRKSYELSFSVHQYLSLQELDLLFLAEKWNVEERLLRPAIIFPSVPSKRSNLTSNDACFVTVQDVNLSEDILQLYKTRTLLVRARIDSGNSFAFLGFIKGEEAIWLEDVEIVLSQRSKLQIDLVTVSNSNDGRFTENELCRGEHDFVISNQSSVPAILSTASFPKGSANGANDNIEVDGLYTLDLVTNVTISGSTQIDKNYIQVGQIFIRIFQDRSSFTLRSIHAKSIHPDDVIASIERMNFPEDDNLNQLGILFTSTCKNLIHCLSNGQQLNQGEKMNKKAASSLIMLDRLLKVICRHGYFHEKNLLRWSSVILGSQKIDVTLKALQVYFQEWLVGDSLQLLIERSKEYSTVYSGNVTMGAFLDEEFNWLNNIARAVYVLLLSRMTSILGNIPAYYQLLESKKEDEEVDEGSNITADNDPLMTKGFVQDIATDLYTMLLIYQHKLTTEYMAARDTFLAPSAQLDQLYFDLSDQIQVLTKYLSRIVPFSSERCVLAVEDCLLLKTVISATIDNMDLFAEAERLKLLSLWKKQLTWQISTLGVVQVHFSGLVRFQRDLIPQCMRNIEHIIDHLNILAKVTDMNRSLHGESLNFFLCELISLLIACLTKVLGFDYDSKVVQLITKKMNVKQFCSDIRDSSQLTFLDALSASDKAAFTESDGALSPTVPSIISYSARMKPGVTGDVSSSSFIIVGENFSSKILTESRAAQRKVLPSLGGRILSIDDFPAAEFNDALAASAMPPPETTSTANASRLQLIHSIHEASPCFAGLLKLFVMLLKRSDVLNEQEQLTATQLKMYLNSVLFAVVNTKTFRPTSISQCFLSFFTAAEFTEDLQKGLLSLVELVCCIDKVYYEAMLRQGVRSRVDISSLVKDIYLSLSFYLSFANMSSLRLSRSSSSSQGTQETKKTPAARLQALLGPHLVNTTAAADDNQIQLENQLLEYKRQLRDNLIDCLRIMTDEILNLLEQQYVVSGLIDESLVECLESCIIVWKRIVGIREVPIFSHKSSGNNAVEALFAAEYLRGQFTFAWRTLERLYSLPNATVLENYSSFVGARMTLFSGLLEIADVKPFGVSSSSESISSLSAFCHNWQKQTREILHLYFEEKLLQLLVSLSQESQKTIMNIAQEFLHLSTSRDHPTKKRSMDEEIAAHAFTVDLLDTLRLYHIQSEQEVALILSYSGESVGEALFRRMQQLLLYLRAYGQVSRGYVPSSASFERPLCHYLMSIAGSVPLILYSARHARSLSPSVSLADAQRQLNILKQHYTPIVRSRVLRNKVMVMDESEVLNVDETRFDEDFSWENFLGKSEYAFVQVWQFLLLVGMNITRTTMSRQSSMAEVSDVMQSFAESVGLLPEDTLWTEISASSVTKWSVQLQDKEVQTLRDSVTQLLATGYWELASKLVEFYTAVVDWQQLQQLSAQVYQPLSSQRQDAAYSPLPSSSSRTTGVFNFDQASFTSNVNTSGKSISSPAKSIFQANNNSSLKTNSLQNSKGYLSPLQSPLTCAKMRKGLLIPPPPTVASSLVPDSPVVPHTPIASSSGSLQLPSSASHLSPKRNDMLKKELHRMQNKIQEKLKFDKELRAPSQYLAVHFFSSTPNFFTLDELRSCFDPMIVLRADAMQSSFTNGGNPAAGAGNSNRNRTEKSERSCFYEQWFVLKVDMACYAACMDYYRYYLQDGQHKVSDYSKTGQASFLQHPLQISSLTQRLKACFPEYIFVPPHYDVSQMAKPVTVHNGTQTHGSAPNSPAPKGQQVFSSEPTAVTPTDLLQGMLHPQEIASVFPRSACSENNKVGKETEEGRQVLKFVQVHPLYVSEWIDASQDDAKIFSDTATSFHHSHNNEAKKDHYDTKKDGTEDDEDENDNKGSDEDEDEDEEEEGNIVAANDVIINSQDVNDIVDGGSSNSRVTRVIRKHLDKTNIDFASFPTVFYSYIPQYAKPSLSAPPKQKPGTKKSSLVNDLLAAALDREDDKEIVRITLLVSSQSLVDFYPSAMHSSSEPTAIPSSSQSTLPGRVESKNLLSPSNSIATTPAKERMTSANLLGSKRDAEKAAILSPQEVLQQARAVAMAAEEQKQAELLEKEFLQQTKESSASPTDIDLANFKRDFLSRVNTTALSSWNVAWQVEAVPMLAVHAGIEVLFQHAIQLTRCQRMLTHVLSLKATEWVNQPEQSLLHTDNAFAFVFCLLCELLQQPNHSVVSLLNAEHIIMMENERHEVRWQAVRKHGKREYMRQVAVYEEQQKQLQNNPNSVLSPPSTSAAGLSGSSKTGIINKQQKKNMLASAANRRPIEPDWEAIREEYDAQSGLMHVQSLSTLSQHCWHSVRKLLRLLRRIVTKIQEMSEASAANATAKVTRNGGQESLVTARARQLSKFSASVGDLNDAEIAEQHGAEKLRLVDTDLRLKQKLLLYVEALYAAAEIGIDLN
jgi:hypothetical protein